MKQKTTIQKIKDLIEETNVSRKKAFDGFYENYSLLEIIEEEPHLLVIRATDNDCFTFPNTIIKASQRWHISFMVSYRFLVEEIDGNMTFPVLVMRF